MRAVGQVDPDVAEVAQPGHRVGQLPADHRQLFELLTKHKVVSASLSTKLISMAGFRNVLVHEYLDIDRRRVYGVLTKSLGDFEKFIKAVSKLL